MARVRRMSRAAAVSLALALTVAAAGTASAVPAGRGAPRPPDGVWRMDGYGTLVTIGNGKLATYDTTRVSCLPGAVTADQVGAPGPAGATRYGEGSVATMTVTPDGRGRAVLAPDDAAGVRHLERLSALPERCRRPAEESPLAVFDRFWATFAENYPFFAAKGIDWQAVRDRYRPLVTPGTTDAELQRILTDMIRPLHDAHTALIHQGKTVYFGLRPGTRVATPELRTRAAEAVSHQLVAPVRSFAQGKLVVGELPDQIRYLRIDSFDGYVAGDSYQQQAAELDRALDALIPSGATADRLRGLVIDCRLNGGGSDALGLRIAARLTDRAYTAYTKVARNDPDDPARYTRPQPITVHPAPAPRWTGPVALLTSGSSVSAAETFTQALMGRTPQVTRIGENTQGVFSDVLFRPLAKDWAAVLPNEKYLDRAGHSFDGPGIPPQSRIPVFTEDDLTHRRDPALTLARRVMAGSG
ncbi:peptidase S41 [Streptomyces sp. SDr-06]|uniref:S41 family peptidase n=1 Tax=Streptomyces sp. SDr-06 TaxID=2267702 RepID=UPI000DE8537D|nr:S41 family peptidase [Streptomyces sp. SDr-06]RCH67293.1 peptidase S41 [Streptomyces sp. SDr-06]